MHRPVCPFLYFEDREYVWHVGLWICIFGKRCLVNLLRWYNSTCPRFVSELGIASIGIYDWLYVDHGTSITPTWHLAEKLVLFLYCSMPCSSQVTHSITLYYSLLLSIRFLPFLNCDLFAATFRLLSTRAWLLFQVRVREWAGIVMK